MLQEARPPRRLVEGGQVVYNEISARTWGTAVYAREGLSISGLEVKASHHGAIAAAEVGGDGTAKPITVISLYGLLEPVRSVRYSITTLHRALSDLTGLFSDRTRRGRIVLGGDFNATLEFDVRQKTQSHDLFFRRIEDFGLESVIPFRGEPVQTWRPNRGSTVWQLDYLFVSKELASRVRDARVLATPPIDEMSDHRPIVVQLAL